MLRLNKCFLVGHLAPFILIFIIFCSCGPGEQTPAALTEHIDSTTNLLLTVERKLDRQEFENLPALLDSADAQTAKGFALDASTEDVQKRLRYAISQCRYQLEHKRSEQFLSTWKEAIKLADTKAEELQAPRTRLLYVKGLFYARSNVDSSIAYCDSALKILNHSGQSNSILKAKALYTKAVAYYVHALSLESVEHVTSALTVAETADPTHQDSVLWGDLYNLRAALHFGFQEFEEAIIWLERYRSTQPATPFFEARYLGNLAAIHYVKYNFQRAIEINAKAIRIRLTQEGPGSTMRLAENYTNQAQFYLSFEIADSAAKYMEKALDIRRNDIEKHSIAIANTEHSLGNIYMLQGKMDKARSHIEKADRLFKESLPRYARTLGDYYDIRSTFHEKVKEYPQALFYRQEGLRVALNNPDSLTGSDNPALASIILPSQALGHLIAKTRILIQLSQRSNAEDLDEAIETGELALTVMEQMRTDIHADRFHWTLGKFVQPLHQLMVDAYLKRYSWDKKQIDIQQAFRVANGSKAAMLKRLQRESKAIEHVAIPDSLRQLQRNLKKRIWRLETVSELVAASTDKQSRQKKTALEDSISSLTSRYRKLRLNLKNDFPAARVILDDSTKLDFHRLQLALAENNSILLELFTNDNMLHIFALSKDTLTAKTVVMDSLFNKNYSHFKSSINSFSDNYQQFCNSASALYDALIGPFQEQIDGSNLVIIPDRRFFDFPFSALLVESAPANKFEAYGALPFLSKTLNLRYSYSAALLYVDSDQTMENSAKHSFLGIAPGFQKASKDKEKLERIGSLLGGKDSAEVTTIPPLPYSIQEAETIAELFLRKKSNLPIWLSGILSADVRLRLGASANKTQLLTEQLNNYSHIHISTHGFYDEQNPALSGFILSPDESSDGIVLPGDLYGLELDASLVVLNGCESGRGSWSAGEGLIGPCQALLHAGARSVLVALWKTENRSSSFFFKAFYEALLEQDNKLDALRQARFACQTSEDFQHPFFWAGFILVGEADAPAASQ